MKNTIYKIFVVALTSMIFVSFTSNASPIKNGFDLSNSLIPVSKILSGGPPRDGIPSIDKPKFVAVDEVDFLKEDDRILGINYLGESRAYPINILNWHEIVNDRIKDKTVAVTYCPLCGSGIVYKADINGKSTQFGVSGLLYNSDVLLYDRETETLWSQILAKAISGKLINSKLDIIPSSHTSWKAWKLKHPETKVLSTDTGFTRDYKRSPYGSYDQEVMTFFPVEFKSKRYHPKERVLGLSLNGKHKVYPFTELAKHRSGKLIDTFADETINIEFDAENRDGSIINSKGEVLPSINTFWFAWYGFHPKGDIYQFKKGAKK